MPDWLNVVARRVKARSKHAQGFVADVDPRMAALARGIVRHHADDGWFHETAAFAELSWHLTARVRDALSPDDGLRPSFLGHILVELLLDSTLIADEPARLDAYYQAMSAVDADFVEQAVGRIAARPPDRLAQFVPLFIRERFLWDYGDDGKLWFRLNQVMRRVKLPPLPEAFRELLPEARRHGDRRKDDVQTPADHRRFAGNSA